MKATIQTAELRPASSPGKRLLSIQRDAGIRFHELGTLTSVTRWVSSHDEGIAEWLKNSRRAYQCDRANVEEAHRTALLLLQDAGGKAPARIALLDTGGATLEDVTAWSVWQDPHASGRGSAMREEETQGNGGKAYMYRLFRGSGRILGVRENRLNCKGFEGAANSLERGIPGFIPDSASGCNLPNVSWKTELRRALKPYGLSLEDLPAELREALRHRKAFTLVEGVDPAGFFKGRIEAGDLVARILRHDQSTLAVQQMRLYAAHNGRLLNAGKSLELEEIPAYPGFEQPVVFEIPESLPDAGGACHSTTLQGKRAAGRLILYTSGENMPNAYRKLRPRWKVSYRTSQQMIGSKPISEVAPGVPGAQYIYATVELPALEPDYVELGRKRPTDGPLVEALDLFIAEAIRSLAKAINDSRRREMDQHALDEVYEENRALNCFKNRFLPSEGNGSNAGASLNGHLSPRGAPEQTRVESSSETGVECGGAAQSIELGWGPGETLRIGCGTALQAGPLLNPKVRDAGGKAVASAELEWHSSDARIVRFGERNELMACGKGTAHIWARLKNTARNAEKSTTPSTVPSKLTSTTKSAAKSTAAHPGKSAPIESAKITVDVWIVDHVLLTPRSLELPLGRRKQIIAEVTNDEGARAANVLLNWKQDAGDPLTVRIQPNGWVTGNRIGQATVTAGAGIPEDSGVWARIPTEISVLPAPDEPQRGAGFPELRLTDRDTDPATGEIREGDPEQPALWQEVSDYQNNLWWLNLQSPDAAFFFGHRGDDIRLWRAFHAQKVVDMVLQVHMREEFDARGETERPDLWARHKVILDLKEVQLKQAMWDKLQTYVNFGGGLD
jgi:hypothetical protein